MKTFNYDLPVAMKKEALRQTYNEIEKNHAMGIFDDGDPNHPKYNNGINYATGKPLNLFGYPVGDFLSKQYK